MIIKETVGGKIKKKARIAFFLFLLLSFVEVAENAQKKNWIKLYHNKYFCENFNLNFSLQNKKLQQIFDLRLKKRIKDKN